MSALACENTSDIPSDTGGGAGTPAASGAASGGGGAGGAPSATAGSTSDVAGSSGSGGGANGGGGAAPAGGGSGGEQAGAATGGGGSSGDGGGGGGGGQAGAGGDANVPARPKRVLLYHFSTLNIASVPAQLTFLESQLQGWGYEVEKSVDPSKLSASNLERLAAVGMINTCFEPFGAGKMGATETEALAAFVAEGGGLFGTHCASVTFQSAQPPHAYNSVIGGRGGDGYFDGKSACRTLEQHPTTSMLAATFDYTGNLDNADYLAPDATVLVKCKWSGGAMKDVAVSWVRTPGKGRVFYTNFAKEDNDLRDATLGAKHILLGLSWVLGR